jgi:hypothetical protein
MSEHDQSRKFTDKSAAIANETPQKGKAAVEQSAQAIEQSYSVTLEKMRDYNRKMIDMAQANTAAVFDFARQLSTAKSSSGRHTHESNSGFSTNRSRSLQRSDRSSLTKVPVRSHAASTRLSRKLLDRRRLMSTSPEHRPYLNGGKPSNERPSSKDAACIGGNHSPHSSHWARLGPGLA